MALTNGVSLQGGMTIQHVHKIVGAPTKQNATSSNMSSVTTALTKAGVNTNNTQINKVLKGWSNFISTVSNTGSVLNKQLASLTNSAVKLGNSIGDLTQKLSKITTGEISTAQKNFDSMTNGFFGQMNKAGQNIDVDALHSFKSATNYIGKMSDNVKEFASIDVKDFTEGMKRSKSVGNHEVNLLKKFNKFDPKLINSLGNMGAGAFKKAEGYIKLASMTNGQLSKSLRRDDKIAWKNFDRMQKMNDISREKARQDRTKWFDELAQKGIKSALFGEIDPDTGKKKAGTGLLGGDIKAALLNGLKGAFIGVLVGMIFKGIKAVGKALLIPMQVAKKLAVGVFGFLKKSLTGAETFKKLIELVMLPFTLLFTLLFAPILVKLAPLLVDLVNQVVSKWDVLESIGDKIAEVLTYFFDEDQWFSFSNIIDTIITTLDDLANVALNAFNTSVNAGESGLEVLTNVAVSLVFAITDKILAFLLSGECFSLMTSIGTVVGTVLYNGIKVAFGLLVPLFEGIGSIITSLFSSLIYDSVRTVATMIKNKVVELFPNLSGILGISASENTADFSGTLEQASNMLEYLQAKANSNSTSNNITTTTSYSTTNYYPSGTGYGSTASKDYGW